MKYFKKMNGERVYLSPISADDAEIYAEWLNDREVSGYLGNYSKTISLVNEKKFLERITAEGQNYAIVLIENDRLIGNISLNKVDHLNRIATLGVFIGDAQYRSKGYGAEAIRLILDYGFRTLNLHNIMLEVFSDNERAMACYQKVGFREFGRRHEARFKDGKYVDCVYMEILDTQFLR